jgi:hypothetical protein
MEHAPCRARSQPTRRGGAKFAAFLLTVVFCAAFSAAAAPQNPPVQPQPFPSFPRASSLPGLTAKQKRGLLKERFEKNKRRAAELVKLSQALQRELDKSNPDVMSLEVIEKAEKIEKLAKKIKDEARGY